MKTSKYKEISSMEQYLEYCNIHEGLVFSNDENKAINDEIGLLTLLIKEYDQKHSKLTELEPIELLKSFMKEHKLKNKDLAKILNVGEPTMSDILNLRKGLSKKSIAILSAHFMVVQEAFNR